MITVSKYLKDCCVEKLFDLVSLPPEDSCKVNRKQFWAHH